MAVIRVSGQSLGGEHELPTFRALQGDGNRDFHSELIGRTGLCLADACVFRRMQAVDRLSPLVQPLLKHRACELEGLAEYGLVMLASAITTGVFM